MKTKKRSKPAATKKIEEGRKTFESIMEELRPLIKKRTSRRVTTAGQWRNSDTLLKK